MRRHVGTDNFCAHRASQEHQSLPSRVARITMIVAWLFFPNALDSCVDHYYYRYYIFAHALRRDTAAVAHIVARAYVH